MDPEPMELAFVEEEGGEEEDEDEEAMDVVQEVEMDEEETDEEGEEEEEEDLPPELERPAGPTGEMLIVQIPREFSEEPLKEQMEYFRTFVSTFSTELLFFDVPRHLKYTGDVLGQWVQMVFGSSASILIFMRGGMSYMKSNCLRNVIYLPGVDPVMAGNMMFEALLEKIDYRLTKITPRVVLADGFPLKPVSVKHIGFNCGDPLVEHHMASWMPHLRDCMWILPGDINTEADEQRFWNVYNAYFKNVKGATINYAPFHVINAIRRKVPRLTINSPTMRTGEFARWIKSWALGIKGFSHLADVQYANPNIHYTNKVFYAFFGKAVRLQTYAVSIRNVHGHLAVLSIKEGALLFTLGKSSDCEHIDLDDLRQICKREDFVDNDETDPKFAVVDEKQYKAFGFSRQIEKGVVIAALPPFH